MKKKDEISDPQSCLNKAASDEPIFILRAKDPASGAAIQAWVAARIRLGLNVETDGKIAAAQGWLRQASRWRDDQQDRLF